MNILSLKYSIAHNKYSSKVLYFRYLTCLNHMRSFVVSGWLKILLMQAGNEGKVQDPNITRYSVKVVPVSWSIPHCLLHIYTYSSIEESKDWYLFVFGSTIMIRVPMDSENSSSARGFVLRIPNEVTWRLVQIHKLLRVYQWLLWATNDCFKNYCNKFLWYLSENVLSSAICNFTWINK